MPEMKATGGKAMAVCAGIFAEESRFETIDNEPKAEARIVLNHRMENNFTAFCTQ